MISRSGRCTIYRQEKGLGEFRLIYVPSGDYREELFWCKKELQQILDTHMESCADHAFVEGRNCVSNADVHIGMRYVLSLDIADFFDSVNRSSLNGLLSEDLLSWVMEDGAPRQGLPTSPLVANIAMLDVDRRIRKLCESLGVVNYSRYADDISLSFKERSLRMILEIGIETILASHGMAIKARKTRLQNANNGCIHITGVAIGNRGVRPTRATLRRIRAAMHQGNTAYYNGLVEWARCRYPRVAKTR